MFFSAYWLTIMACWLFQGPGGALAQTGSGSAALTLQVPSFVLGDLGVRVVARLGSGSGFDVGAGTPGGQPFAVNYGGILIATGVATTPNLLDLTVQLPAIGDQPLAVRLGNTGAVCRVRSIPGALAVVPAAVAILLCLLTREVLWSLFVGLFIGALVFYEGQLIVALTHMFDERILGALTDRDHAMLIVTAVMLGGLFGLLDRSGAMLGLSARLAGAGGSTRGTQFFAWALSAIVFCGESVRVLIVGGATRPMTDRQRVGREKLAWLIDTTSTTVTAFLVFTTFVAFDPGPIRAVLAGVGIHDLGPAELSLQTLPLRFYGLLTLFFGLLICVTGKDFGTMLAAERRSHTHGKLVGDNTDPLGVPPPAAMPRNPPTPTPSPAVAEGPAPAHWIHGAIPILIILGGVIGGVTTRVPPQASLLIAATLATFVGLVMGRAAGLFGHRSAARAFAQGGRSVAHGVMILVLAWSLGALSHELQADRALAALLVDAIPPWLLPATVFGLAAMVGLAGGTPLVALAALSPLVLPVVVELHGAYFQHHMSEFAGIMTQVDYVRSMVLLTIAVMLEGALFGNHCSPIAPSTVLASMAAGSDHLDHVSTQLPYAFFNALLAVGIGFLPMAFGLTSIVLLPAAMIIMLIALQMFGVDIEPGPRNES